MSAPAEHSHGAARTFHPQHPASMAPILVILGGNAGKARQTSNYTLSLVSLRAFNVACSTTMPSAAYSTGIGTPMTDPPHTPSISRARRKAATSLGESCDGNRARGWYCRFGWRERKCVTSERGMEK